MAVRPAHAVARPAAPQAPEVLEGEKATAASDVYSFAMVGAHQMQTAGLGPCCLPQRFEVQRQQQPVMLQHAPSGKVSKS